MKSSVSYREFKRREFSRRKREAILYVFSNKAKLIMIVVIFSVVLVLGMLAGARFIYASSHSGSEDGVYRVKCYKSVMIYMGDTLDSIAEANYNEGKVSKEAYANEIAHMNHLYAETELIPGNYLVVPYFSEMTPRLELEYH